MTVSRPLRVTVIGAADASDDERALAHRVGSVLGGAGAVTVCGGRGGVMMAVARGASEAGGVTVGLLPGADASGANRWISIPLPTGLGEARNALVARAGEAVVAIGGSWGTLSEIALAKKMGVSVCTLGRPPVAELGLPAFADADEAARWALQSAERFRKG